jgi:glycosyltransferase involved in cell wall biosynthesis
MLSSPLISIITVTYNAKEVLEPTIQSVLAQTFTDFEYLIIDGGSTDGTLEIIRKHEKKLAYWISEPDKGLYDAMNKGLQKAKGRYVWFMNAGDLIYEPCTLSHVFEHCEPDADVYYGDALFFSPTGETVGLRSLVTPHQLPEQLTWHSLRLGMVVCHQSLIVRRSIAPFYDLSHPYSSDVDWEIESLKRAKKIIHTHAVLSRYLTGGLSKKHHRESLIDRYQVLRKHFGTVPTVINHLAIALRGFLFILKRRKRY